MPRSLVPIIKGTIFGELTTTGGHFPDGKHHLWECFCSCGNVRFIEGTVLRNGKAKSCGCLKKTGNSSRKHGMSGTRIYHTWGEMKARCTNPKHKNFNRYGGRGITVCDEWLDSSVFFQWALSNGYSDNLTIERIDNNIGYSPTNCKFIPQTDQCLNQEKTHRILVNGVAVSLRRAAKIAGITYQVAKTRYKNTGSINAE